MKRKIVIILVLTLLIFSIVPIMNAEYITNNPSTIQPKNQSIYGKNINLVDLFETGYAQPPDVIWEKTYGGSGQDVFRSVQQTSDGGYIAVGMWNREAHWLMKVDSNGVEEWNVTALTNPELYPRAYFVEETNDGGFIVCGCHEDYPDGYDRCLWKVDKAGQTEWLKKYTDPEIGYFICVHQTNDDGFIVTGFAGEQDAILVKTDKDGNLEWQRMHDIDGYDYGYAVKQTEDNGYIVTGYTYTEADNYDIFLLKTDKYGMRRWTRTYGGEDDELYRSKNIIITDDDGYLLSAQTESYGAGRADLWIIKTDKDGNMLWNETYGEGKYDLTGSVDTTNDNGYIFALTKNLNGFSGTKDDGWIIKTDIDGNVCWSKLFEEDQVDQTQSVRKTNDGGYIIAGNTESCSSCSRDRGDAWLIKLGPDTELTPPVLTKKRPRPGWIYIWDIIAFPIFIVDEAIIYDSLTFKVEAEHQSGISKVEYFIDDQLVVEAIESPFEYLWNIDDIGSYRLKIRAYNNYGGTTQEFVTLEKKS
jgi:hypothetical protein